MEQNKLFKEKLHEEYSTKVGKKEARKIKARREGDHSIWFGLGMFGIVGWSVAIPILIGVAVGLLIDKRWHGRFSWTLIMLSLGVILGCLNAWHWVNKERKKIEEEQKDE